MFGQQPSGHFAEGLVGYWRFIEAGNLVDESFFGNHGTITGATWQGEGLSFNGTSDYVTIPTVTGAVEGSGTVIFRFLLTATPTNNDQLWRGVDSGSSEAVKIRWLTGGGIQFQIRKTAGTATGLATTPAINDNQWYTYAVTWNGDNPIIAYLDGIEVVRDSSIVPPIRRMDNITIAWNTAVLYIPMKMTGVSIYNRALSPSEIQALYIPDLPMQQDPIWLLFSPGGIDIGALMRSIREEKTGGKQAKRGGKQ